jgi:outer membrane protein
MTKFLFGSAIAALALAAPVAASAQAIPGAIVAVVDRDQVARQCTQCQAAAQQLQAQGAAYQQRETQLTAPLQAEQNAIRTALQAAPNNQPDAALQGRMRALQTQAEAAERDLTQRQETLRRNQNYVVNQILERMNPIIGQIVRERGANLALDVGATLAHNPALNITDAVLATMNQNAAPFNVNAPVPAPAPATSPTSTRPAATPPATTPTRPRPTGR